MSSDYPGNPGYDVHALSGAYAVDALDDLERAAFERHLAECPECRAEVASLREAAGTLAETTAVEPPAALRDRVLAGIATTRPLPPEAPAPVSLASRRPRRRVNLLVAAAAAVLAVGGGAVLWQQPWQESSQAPSAVEAVLSAADAKRSSLDFDGGARATLVHSDSVGRAVLVTEKMPPPPPGKVYQVWLDQPGKGMVSAGLMPVREDQRVLLAGDAATATAAGITVEPEGGSDKPTSDPIALFDFGRKA
ncbi:anti-sigma factor [Nocardioides sp. T2.26MG-1]|uniref:anti-sigma factor n=1 Tax=Nocardioides sp. T2.26MG-1 TaxID=3041166 RepID=UPI002477C37C|nr:anti-sigma factor [Nocardioides sp. T2.26MG-1]CAI9411492.1 Anti-sigma-K factor RskA [Nocardioides sp. T2.26MG-1]